MDEAIDNLDSNDQGVFMGLVDPACIDLGKDNVVQLWRITHWALGASGVYHCLRWFLRLLRIFVSRTSAIPDFARTPKYHLDLSSCRCMVGIFP